MGKYSSSTYRVSPLMQWIGADSDRLQQLLKLVVLDGKSSEFIPAPSKIAEAFFEDKELGKKEQGLRPSRDFLKKMVEDKKYKGIRDESFDSDRALVFLTTFYGKDKEEPYKLVPKNINVLEGNTYPDFFIKTDSFILVCEGKWTEKATTTRTKFLKQRNQMIRHIQGAKEYALYKEPGLPVYGIYIVSEEFLKNTENQYIMQSQSFQDEAIDKEEIKMGDDQALRDAYKGYVTWESIQHSLGIKFKIVEEIECSS